MSRPMPTGQGSGGAYGYGYGGVTHATYVGGPLDGQIALARGRTSTSGSGQWAGVRKDTGQRAAPRSWGRTSRKGYWLKERDGELFYVHATRMAGWTP